MVGESSELVPATTGTTVHVDSTIDSVITHWTAGLVAPETAGTASSDATTSPGASSILRRGGITGSLSGVNRARLPHGSCSLDVEARIPRARQVDVWGPRQADSAD